ncbi:NGK_0946 family protein [Avibacterium sp. 21-599]|uniref:NGK_0946 family protein n=1 Tax=Avibacterium sp. 21-599 TaxID=2911528 RepID=UPI0022450294|nr:hypothetical protein [Avibacterium sp. 21-599]MCW9717446.1 hypothetical protein [Avibacterium sp. 21-599]
MKKSFLFTIFPFILSACASGDYHRSAASINAERNSAQSIVTAASLEQARMQRTNELEESIKVRQQQALENQSRRESSSVVTEAIGNGLCALGAIIGACR